jgi:hypothetical protein
VHIIRKKSLLLFKPKAFDSVSWEYRLELLQHRGFLVRWCNWLALKLSSSSSSVRLNDVRDPWIKHKRGLRQGNPLSTYLFIIAIDTLQHILQRATDEELLTPLRDRTARLRLSLYVDDAVVFVSPVQADVDMLMMIMHHFGTAFGLQINVSKSIVAPICCTQLNLDEILQNFAGAHVAFRISYLGLPITLGRLRLVHLQFVFDRATKKLAGWQGNLLNIGGRQELVRAVLGALPTYLLTAIKLPKKFYRDMDKL